MTAGVQRRYVESGVLQDHVVVIVGASSGMGRAIALGFAREGARVTAAARREPELAGLLADAADLPGHVTAVPIDIRRSADAERVVQDVVAREGRIDAIVFAAATNVPRRKLADIRESDWTDIIDTNLGGAFRLTKASMPVFEAQRSGLIIFISSVSAKRGGLSGVAYQASKRGIDGIVHALAQEARESGVRLTVVYPGVCDTPLLDRRHEIPTAEERGRALRPEDIAAVCVFIAAQPSRVHVAEIIVTPLVGAQQSVVDGRG